MGIKRKGLGAMSELDHLTEEQVEALLANEETKGFVESRIEPDGRRLWTLTDAGKRYVEKLLESNPEARRFLESVKRGTPS